MHRLTRDMFLPSCTSTVGTGCGTWAAKIDATNELNLQIWDTAGKERYRSLGGIFYQNAEAAIVVYSKDDKGSAKNVKSWVTQFRSVVGTEPYIAIVANKIDIDYESQINLDEKKYYMNCDVKKSDSEKVNGNELMSTSIFHSTDSNIYDSSIYSSYNSYYSNSSSNNDRKINHRHRFSPSNNNSNYSSKSEENLENACDGKCDDCLGDDIYNEVSHWAKQRGFFYVETSAKTGQGVRELFQCVARAIYEKMEDPSRFILPPASAVRVDSGSNKIGMCC
ncbi:hypothetical protein TRFO_33782 [Tritrichomonas foetus]|uniref:Uncharacterized protein n=1 Tax=Tritrichomonas foetus TaxID=1144522 RepID=A0A1J4JKY2_9EUKA|nr:hypothetical protein TRFO_33782 [Tritrichomonas foetus]|eukprot:OHS99746.1 hypothetical protein TRFO_33782 [Tritrichomonas foetus]